MKIDKVVLEKIQRTYTIGFNCQTRATEWERIVYFSNGGKISVSPLLSEIGNKGLDSWVNVEKIKRSTSNKNIMKYLEIFIDRLETCK